MVVVAKEGSSVIEACSLGLIETDDSVVDIFELSCMRCLLKSW